MSPKIRPAPMSIRAPSKSTPEAASGATLRQGDAGRDLLDLKAFLEGSSLTEAALQLAQELGIEPRLSQRGISLETYATLKHLPLEFLKSLGLETVQNPYRPSQQAVSIPYRRPDGSLLRVRYRVAGQGNPKLIWDKAQGHSVSLYGLDRLKEGGDPLFLVEGESDCHTLWFRGRAALGAPGAATFRPARDDVFLEGRRMIALVEPDQGGEALLQRLMQSSHKDRIAAARLSGFKDVSELHIHEPERFDEILNAAVEGAEPLAQVHAAQAARPRRRRAAADEDDKEPTQADRLIGFAESEAMLRSRQRRVQRCNAGKGRQTRLSGSCSPLHPQLRRRCRDQACL